MRVKVWAITVKSWGESCNMQSGKQTHQKFVFHFCKRLLWSIIDREINDIYLQEMWYLLSNMHHWFLSTITAGAPEPEQSQSYRQSLSPDFLRKEGLTTSLCFLNFSVISQRSRVYLSQNMYILSTNYKHGSVEKTWLVHRTRFARQQAVAIC